MTHDEMIAVIAAHRDKKKIERREVFGDSRWFPAPTPIWNFDKYEYRIAEPKWRDATIDDLKRAPLRCRVRRTSSEVWINKVLDGCCISKGTWETTDHNWFLYCQVIDE